MKRLSVLFPEIRVPSTSNIANRIDHSGLTRLGTKLSFSW